MSTIRERILARGDLAAARKARDLDALAAGLNAQPELTPQPRYITARTILAECGTHGPGILATLDAAVPMNSAVKYAVRFLGQDSGLNVGDPVTQAMIDSLAPDVLTMDQAAALKALALQPQLVDRMQVEVAMFNPDGSEK
jgi:hypothetical protein